MARVASLARLFAVESLPEATLPLRIGANGTQETTLKAGRIRL